MCYLGLFGENKIDNCGLILPETVENSGSHYNHQNHQSTLLAVLYENHTHSFSIKPDNQLVLCRHDWRSTDYVSLDFVVFLGVVDFVIYRKCLLSICCLLKISCKKLKESGSVEPFLFLLHLNMFAWLCAHLVPLLICHDSPMTSQSLQEPIYSFTV